MANAIEFCWVIAAILAAAFVTFMAVFAGIAFAYWTIGLLHF